MIRKLIKLYQVIADFFLSKLHGSKVKWGDTNSRGKQYRKKTRRSKSLSRIDDFMSRVIDLDETEKEEVIRVLASILGPELKVIPDKPSKNVMLVLIPFLSNLMIENLKKTV